jgi:hypothetical protein
MMQTHTHTKLNESTINLYSSTACTSVLQKKRNNNQRFVIFITICIVVCIQRFRNQSVVDLNVVFMLL